MVILIVDHNADDVHVFSEAAKSLDFSVQCIAAYSGQQAFEILESGVVPHYIFLDLSIQQGNARDTLRKLKKNRGYKKIPVIIFSETVPEKEMEAFKKAGADQFLIRTPGLEDLSNSLKSILQGSA